MILPDLKVQKEIKGRIVAFQKTIHDLNREIRERDDALVKEQKRHLLAEIEWFELINSLVAEQNESSADSDSAKKLTLCLGTVERIRKKIQRFLTENEIQQISPKTIREEPDHIKVVETRQDSSLPSDTILEILRHGYKWKNISLRKAEVIAVKN
jgi:molecular chaperone GrpE (heat shock protein)